jgi:transcriptional regulator with XRE-family HTH domain
MSRKKQDVLVEVCKRFVQIRYELDMTQTEFGEFLEMEQGGLSHIEREVSNPSLYTIKLLCEKIGLSFNWLFLGKGEKYLKNDENFKSYDDKIKLEYFEIIKKETQEVIERRAKDEKFKKATQNAV